MQQTVTFFNTLGRQEMEFKPVEPGTVRLYTCGPTVYNFAHIGNLRTYVLWDVLSRMLSYFGYEVRHVMNVTDVGHLTSDADSGEDRMLLGARREGKSVWEIARYYEKVFFDDLAALNVRLPRFICRATEHIPEMIALVQDILNKGYGYESGGNVYFSVDRFPGYGTLASHVLDQQLAEARVDPDENKRNPFDFVLWFTESKYLDQVMKWDSPWGTGFPGWHVECSAMAIKYLGEYVDIHCGGVDHIPVHHTNEIAQSESVLGHQWVNFWLHSEFLMMKKDRMSKSSGQFITLAEIHRRGFLPLEYRYFCLGAHYRSKMTFDWTALEGARNALDTLRNRYLDWTEEPSEAGTVPASDYAQEFSRAIARDLDIPQALAVLWKMVKDPQLGNSLKRKLLLDFDRVLGFGVASWERDVLPADLQQLLERRENARKSKDFATSDALREQLLAAGVAVKDTPQGQQWYYSRKKQSDL
jgi:cysteinyl-tRNA synthetase